VLEPRLLRGVVVFVVRTRLDLLLQLRLLPVLLRLRRNRVGMSCSGLEFGTAMGGCTGAVARVAGLMEPGLGTWVDMSTGLTGGLVWVLVCLGYCCRDDLLVTYYGLECFASCAYQAPVLAAVEGDADGDRVALSCWG